MARSARLAFALALVLLGGGLLVHSFAARYAGMGIGAAVGPVFYPRILLGLWLLLGFVVLWEAARASGPAGAGTLRWGPPLLMLGATAAAIWAMRWVGYIGIAAPLAFACGWLLGYRRLAILALTAAIAGVASWWLFDRALGIPLPRWRLT